MGCPCKRARGCRGTNSPNFPLVNRRYRHVVLEKGRLVGVELDAVDEDAAGLRYRAEADGRRRSSGAADATAGDLVVGSGSASAAGEEAGERECRRKSPQNFSKAP